MSVNTTIFSDSGNSVGTRNIHMADLHYFDQISPKTVCYDLSNFKPLNITRELLVENGINYPIHDGIASQLSYGSQWFKGLYETRSLTPGNHYIEALADVNEELEIHNYTGMCPTNVLEVSPSEGSCSIACQYCLVTDGKHIQPIKVFTNYAEKVANSLERNYGKDIFYYFSPKTEAFSESHLYNGLAHDIIRAFIAHFEKYPDSGIRIFIATKAGLKHLNIKHQGESILDLMGKIASKIQVNGSIGIMPKYLQDVLESNAATVAERLEALVKCQELGMAAESVLCQPLVLPYLTEETLDNYMAQLSAAGVTNIKPEFLTSEVRNLVVLAQYMNHFDPHLIGEFFHPYLADENQDHIKQRSRLAPSRAVSIMYLDRIKKAADNHGISISICNWVKRELGAEASWVKKIDRLSASKGYRCLGYQTNIFKRA